jgi:lipopolysaccharide biosynthesis glycosyltransferase
MSPSKPVIAFVTDEQYVMALAATVASVLVNCDRAQAVEVVVVDAGVSSASKAKLARMERDGRLSLRWLSPMPSHLDVIRALPAGYVGKAAYHKLFLPEWLQDHSRIICLDCDVIVEGNIGELWAAATADNYVLAAQDLLNPFVSSPFGLKNWRALGRRATDELFNTGVLVVNAEKWRREQATPRLLDYLREHRRHVQLCDQDAMNAVFEGQWGRLDRRWNVLQYFHLARRYALLEREDHEALLEQARAIHFCGPRKPWHAPPTTERDARFFHYLDQTPWAGWRPKWWTRPGHVLAYYTRRAMALPRRML